jgi:hypothetical protein
MKKRIIVLKKGIDKNMGPEAFCCGGPLIAYMG